MEERSIGGVIETYQVAEAMRVSFQLLCPGHAHAISIPVAFFSRVTLRPLRRCVFPVAPSRFYMFCFDSKSDYSVNWRVWSLDCIHIHICIRLLISRECGHAHTRHDTEDLGCLLELQERTISTSGKTFCC